MQTLGLPVSPLNRIDSPLDTPSYNGSFSEYLAVTVQLQGQPQLQFVEVPPEI